MNTIAPDVSDLHTTPLRGRISLWPKLGAILLAIGVLLLWMGLMFSSKLADTIQPILDSIPLHGLVVPYPLLITLAALVALGCVLWPVAVALSADVSFDGSALRFADGIVTREQTVWHVSRIETVEVFSPLLGRIMGYGTLRIAAMGGSELWVVGLRRPQILAQSILSAQTLAAEAFMAARMGQPPLNPMNTPFNGTAGGSATTQDSNSTGL